MNKLLLIFLSISAISFGAEPSSFLLGRELLNENSAELAAVEFRRYALENEDAADQSQACLHAAYAYLQAEKLEDAKNMLDRAEALDPEDPSLPVLNAELAARAGDSETALYFFDLIDPEDPLHAFTTRRSAEIQLRQGNIDQARQRISAYSPVATNSLTALDEYAMAPSKSPRVGGLLGLIPGAGYWYSGETANGFRSLILNSLFMFGMVQTAQDDQWGAFAAISFFEVTWYSGSIYGGIDAAHRFNKNQLDRCVERLNVPDIRPRQDITIPLFQLKVAF